MTYYYIHPFRPQYFFPKGFKEHAVFTNFFKPFSFLGNLSWWLFNNSAGYRLLFKKENIEAFIPEDNIRKVCGKTALMAFNIGTVGPEQKITALGYERNTYFFIKYAKTPLSISNVKNEYAVLNAVKSLNFVPSVESFHEVQNNVLLKTNVLHGHKLGALKANDSILERTIQISKIKYSFNHNTKNNLKSVFAHGDFCPWNMMLSDGEILVFDWEMGGNYPLGYDLFTYIFQTSFLLEPDIAVTEILSENNQIISSYFIYFKIFDWYPYLLAFAEIKIKLEQRKTRGGLLGHFNKLLVYAQDL